MKKLNRQCKKYDVCIDSAFFYLIGINNLINFAKVKYREITSTSLHTKKIKNWWNSSKNLFSCCLDITESFAFITLQFIKTFSYLKMNNINLHQQEYTNGLIRYSDTIINYFRSKIENNIFIIKEENKIKKEKLSIEKKEKYYPLIINLPVYNVLSNKMDQMGFVPYLIYEDILNCVSYNKKLF